MATAKNLEQEPAIPNFYFKYIWFLGWENPLENYSCEDIHSRRFFFFL